MMTSVIKKEPIDESSPRQFSSVSNGNKAISVKKENNSPSRVVRQPCFVWDKKMKVYQSKTRVVKSNENAKQSKITEFINAQQWRNLEITKINKNTANYAPTKRAKNNVHNPVVKRETLDKAVQTDVSINFDLSEDEWKRIDYENKMKELNSINMPVILTRNKLEKIEFMREKTVLETIRQLSMLRSIIQCIRNTSGKLATSNQGVGNENDATRSKEKGETPSAEENKYLQPQPTSLLTNNKRKNDENLLNVTPIANKVKNLNDLMYTYNPYKK